MSLDNFWNQNELFFYCEFINEVEFDSSKTKLLKNDNGTFYINRDFTIYQEKQNINGEITELDIKNNYATFMRILYHLPESKVIDFIKFHYEKYQGKKIDFIHYLYDQFISSKLTQGGQVLPPPKQKLLLLDWCERKTASFITLNEEKPPRNGKAFINNDRIKELQNIHIEEFDLNKLIRLLQELNVNFASSNFLSVAMLGRSIINHIPPIFGFTTFNDVVNQYGGNSFKKNMKHLNESMRSIADNYLHSPIRRKETLPNENQIDFSREFDFLLAEIISRLNNN
jgi:hypothetical protein